MRTFHSSYGFTLCFVLGKRLKKGPEDFQDVRNEVQRDYRLWTERTQMEELKRGFRIEINQDILKPLIVAEKVINAVSSSFVM